ncbi:MAG: class I SAM-dependent methyltransferase [Jatrophihabitantaceae bacterium]
MSPAPPMGVLTVPTSTAAGVLATLEERSRREQAELDRLNSIGAGATRAAAPGLMLDVGPDVGRLLNALVRIVGAKQVLEIGGSVGYSTIWLADAAAAVGGRVVSVEPDPGKAAQLRDNVAAAGFADQVEVLQEDIADVLPRLSGPLDLVLIDHWKDLYVREFDAVWPLVRTGGVVIADNVLLPEATRPQMRDYQEHVQAAVGAYSLTLPLGDGVELTWQTGSGASP